MRRLPQLVLLWSAPRLELTWTHRLGADTMLLRVRATRGVVEGVESKHCANQTSAASIYKYILLNGERSGPVLGMCVPCNLTPLRKAWPRRSG